MVFTTKNKSNLHLPPSKLTVFQRGPHYSGIKAFNNLPTRREEPSSD